MSSTTVRINERTHTLLRELAEESQMSMSAVIETALVEHQRRRFWEQARRDFAELRSDPVAWEAEQQELAVWEAVISDGLEDGDD